jgi:WD40 repeat protein/serine/threonine protein kinase
MADPHPNLKDQLLNDLGSSFGTPAERIGETAASPAPPSIPDHALIRCIGKGSYGEVWLARNALGTMRAVKIVYRASFDSERPYEREFAGIRRFEPVSRSHPSQLNVLHVGRDDAAGLFYYVMELADDANSECAVQHTASSNSSLSTYLSYAPRSLRSEMQRRGRLPCSECLNIGLALATALDHLHRHGLVHRDIKPSNIVFVNGIPKLADIGLVTHVEATLSFVGTEGYLPPEGPGTAQADIYSFGKVLYEMSTGRDRQDYPELPTNLIEAPSAERAAMAELNEVIVKACHADSKQRYQTAAEMHADLALLQSGKSVSQMRTIERRLRFLQRAGAAAAALAAVIAVGWLWQAHETRIVRDLANEKSRLLDEKTTLAREKSAIAEENRERIVRLDVANGVRLMDQDDFSGALSWFADALTRATNRPAEEVMHRIRFQQVFDQSPALVHVLPHDSGVISSSFCRDGKRIATGTLGKVRLWDAASGRLLLGPIDFGKPILSLRFTADGQRLLVSPSSDEGHSRRPNRSGSAGVIDGLSGRELWLRVTNVTQAAFSPDDRWLAVVRTNFSVEVLNVSDGRRILELTGHTGEVTMLSFSVDGTLLASASQDQTVRVWRIPSGEPFGKPIRHSHPVEWAIFSPNSQRLATAGFGPSEGGEALVHTWETSTLQEVGSSIPTRSGAFGLCFDRTNRRLVLGDSDHWFTVLDAETHLPFYPHLRLYASTIRSWDTSADGHLIATGSDDYTARVWDLETGRALTPWLQHAGYVESVHFSPDGKQLLTTSDDGTAKVWNLAACAARVKRLALNGAIHGRLDLDGCAFSPDAHRLIVSLKDRTLHSIDLSRLVEEGPAIQAVGNTTATLVGIDRSGHYFAAAPSTHSEPKSDTKTAGLWRKDSSWKLVAELPQPGIVRDLAFNETGDTLVTFGEKNAWMWNVVDGTFKREVTLPKEARFFPIVGATLGNFFPAELDDGQFRLFDLVKECWMGVSAPSRLTGAFALSPDRSLVATAGADQCGRIWDLRGGLAVTPPFKHGGNLSWIEWSPDAGRVITTGMASDVKMWDAATGHSLLFPMRIGEGPFRVAHFSPDGRFIVARCDSQLARVWDAATGEPVTPLLRHEAWVRAAIVTAEGRLVTVSDPAVFRAWDLVPTSLPVAIIPDFAKFLSGRQLTSGGVLSLIPAEELAELGRSLRARAPDLFE